MANNTYADFTETVLLEMPDTGHLLDGVKEAHSDGVGYIHEIAAIHEGLTANYNNYRAEQLEAALESWVSPYPKPIIINHDLMTDPLGRVMAAKMDKESDGTVYTRLQVAITDPTALARVTDKRYLTGSVGGKSKHALCSVCNSDWAEASMFNVPCKHVRGKTYKGKLAFLDRIDIGFKEYSFVNAPADDRSVVLDGSNDEKALANSDEWVRASHLYELNLDKEEILEYADATTKSILANMKKKEATPLYLQIKGAFLSALSVHEAGLGIDTKESSDVDSALDHSDIVDVMEQLSTDLSSVATESEEEETPAEETPAEEEVPEGEEASAEDAEPAEETEETPEAEAADSTDAEDAEDADEDKEEESDRSGTPEAQEDPKGDGGNDTGTQHAQDKTRDSDESPSNVEESEDSGLDTNEGIELRVGALEEQVSSLLNENARLKSALHRTLVERVVDTKIAMGLGEMSDRDSMIEDHGSRSAASLADSLRDLASMSVKVERKIPTEVPELDVKAKAQEDLNAPVDLEESQKKTPKAEDIFVDAFMGRRKL